MYVLQYHTVPHQRVQIIMYQLKTKLKFYSKKANSPHKRKRSPQVLTQISASIFCNVFSIVDHDLIAG
jgi:hypothetical protein